MQQLLTDKRHPDRNSQSRTSVAAAWRIARLGDGIKLISGQHIEAAKANEVGTGTPYLTGPADFPDGAISLSKFTAYPKVMCEPNDILITVKGSGTGKIVVADNVYCISRQLMAVRPVKYHPGWVKFVLMSDEKRYRRAAAGLIPGISREDILGRSVPTPPFSEQKKIAVILSTWDNTIQTTARMLAKTRAQKRALMQHLLTGKKRVTL